MNHFAVLALYPNVVTVDDGLGALDINGNPVEIDINLVNNWVNPNSYKLQRQVEYPSISDQLDMLWHMMDDEIIPGKNSVWYDTIETVKAKYPKSE